MFHRLGRGQDSVVSFPDPINPSRDPVADLGFLKGGFRFRRIMIIARIVSSWQTSMSMQRLRSWHPSTWSAEIFQNLGPLRSHLLAF